MKRILLLLVLAGTCQAAELHRIADLNEQKTPDNAVISTKGNWNNLEIQLNGVQDPNDVNSAMNGTCNIEMDKSTYTHTVIKADSGYNIHEYTFNGDPNPESNEACVVKVDILDKKQQEAKVMVSKGYGCQSYCGMQGVVHVLDGYYR